MLNTFETKSGRISASFCLFSFFSNIILQKKCRLQQDLNSNRRSRRWVRWPLDHHHHGPNVLNILQQNPVTLQMCTSSTTFQPSPIVRQTTCSRSFGSTTSTGQRRPALRQTQLHRPWSRTIRCSQSKSGPGSRIRCRRTTFRDQYFETVLLKLKL